MQAIFALGWTKPHFSKKTKWKLSGYSSKANVLRVGRWNVVSVLQMHFASTAVSRTELPESWILQNIRALTWKEIAMVGTWVGLEVVRDGKNFSRFLSQTPVWWQDSITCNSLGSISGDVSANQRTTISCPLWGINWWSHISSHLLRHQQIRRTSCFACDGPTFCLCSCEITSALLHSQKCSSLDDKLYGHPTHVQH